MQLLQGNARAFHLKFPRDSSRSVFFWSQEPDPKADDTAVDAINIALNSILDGMEVESHAHDESSVPFSSQQAASSDDPLDPRTATVARQLASALGTIMDGSLMGVSSAAPSVPSLTKILKPNRLVPLLENEPSLMQMTEEYLPTDYRSLPAVSNLGTLSSNGSTCPIAMLVCFFLQHN